MGMPKPRIRVVVHPTKKGWSWSQVSRNGVAGAVAPAPFDSKGNALKAAKRQVSSLLALAVEVLGPPPTGELTQVEVDEFVQLEVRDTDPNYA